MAGYSGTPLTKKLGAAPGKLVLVCFTTERDELRARLPRLMESITPDGSAWIAWPKKASKVETDITEDVVREEALPLGLVDTKVCAIDEIWSGLKLVIRKESR
jgi:hypothetical protein